jgi:nickel-dependent lactate racemase
MILFERGSAEQFLSSEDMREGMRTALDKYGTIKRMLIAPPDITRLHSCAGSLTRNAFEHNPAAIAAILPALGTHCPMSEKELETMFGNVPKKLFLVHDWRSGCERLGEIPAEIIAAESEGAVRFPIPVDINRNLIKNNYDCILSIGQVVPHEVAGMAGHNKNIFVGLGGAENIHKTHFLGAAYGMERVMGRSGSPVRAVFDYAIDTYLNSLPIVHALTVIDRDTSGALRPRGLFIGTGKECFIHAAKLSCTVNIQLLEKPLDRIVVYLDPVEYKSFWLGNKSIYRTRMAIADGGSLIVLAPGIKTFGEDAEIDRLIRACGYKGTPAVMRNVNNREDLKKNLSAAAHLIHGSSEDRFSITYCTAGVPRRDVENAGFKYAPVKEMLQRYDPKSLKQGINIMPDGEEIYFIANPATGLWACKDRF